jgi:hypothetical protein
LFSRWTPFLSEPARIDLECLVEHLHRGAFNRLV